MVDRNPDFEAMSDKELREYKRDLHFEALENRRLALQAEERLQALRARADAKWRLAALIAARTVGGADEAHTAETERLYALPDEELAAMDTRALSRDERRAARDVTVIAPGASAAGIARPQEGA